MTSSSSHSASSMQFDPFIIGAMDEQSALLVLQLQFEDIANIFATAKGKGRADDSTADDTAYALRLHQQDLEASMAILEDRKMCPSIARAVQVDQHILAREAEAEAVAVRDRRLAHQIEDQPNTAAAAGGGDDDAVGFPSFCQGGEGEEGMQDRAVAERERLAKLTALYVSEADGAAMLSSGWFFDSDDDEPKGESSSRAAKRQHTAAIDRRCEACRDDKKFFDVATVPHCRHDYCRDCLDQLFRLSMTDESLFPPRCCRQPISFDDVRMFLPTETVREFQRKKPELETPNKTYCHRQGCSTWIPPQSISNDVGVCPQCYLRTCTICKGSTHVGDCPGDEATQQLLQTADDSGWQRCYSCRRVVELDTGCNHISCRCGAQFCYICGSRWKSCTCELWDEARLYGRAAQIQQRRRPLAMPAPPVNAPPLPRPRVGQPVVPATFRRSPPPARADSPSSAMNFGPRAHDRAEQLEVRQPIARMPASLSRAQLLQPSSPPASIGNTPPTLASPRSITPAKRPLPAATTQASATTRESSSSQPPAGPLIASPAQQAVLPSRANGGGNNSRADDRREDDGRSSTTSSSDTGSELRQQQQQWWERWAATEEAVVEAIALHLRENHECLHARWSCVRGRYRCEECGDALPLFIFECRQCMLHA